MFVRRGSMTIAGVTYKVGDPIPSELLSERRIAQLVQLGKIKPATNIEPSEMIPVDPPSPPPPPPPTPQTNKDAVELTKEDLQTIVSFVQTPVSALDEKLLTTEDVRILGIVHAVDPRKTAKEVYEARLKAITEDNSQEDHGDPDEGNTTDEDESSPEGGDPGDAENV